MVNELTDTLGIQGPVIFASVQVDQGILDTWTRKAGASIVRIPDLPDGRMDVGELKNLLGRTDNRAIDYLVFAF